MGTTILKIIPTNPYFVPDSTNQNLAATLLKNLYNPNEIVLNTFDDIQFVDQGSNFDDVRCNYCGTIINIEDWQQAMDISFENKFTDLLFITPCCSKQSSLNELIYNMPAGFSKFEINVIDPENPLNDDNLKELAVILKTSLRIIWARY